MSEKKDNKLRHATQISAFEHTLDLQERANQSAALHMMLGEFIMGMLAHGDPLTMGVQITKINPLQADADQYKVTVYWKRARVNEFLKTMDVPLMKRCLICSDYLLVDHVCGQQILVPGGNKDEVPEAGTPEEGAEGEAQPEN